ncbi:MAG: serine/threonine protein kinase [Gemmatimonadaceae bacterium]|nr:serine/threonine protein kinase [Gemmatimonadaceae bacterium]
MDRERWARIEALVDEALDRPASERPAFLDAACDGDFALREDVASLIDQLEADPDFLEHSVLRRDDPGSPLPAGERIGPWVLQRLLGRGGMGEVYLAVRDLDGSTQRVAIKVIRRGMDTDDVVHRFRLERRILSQLNHPNVAQLLDAGITADGRPWFAMEFVDGVPLTTYCDDRRLGVSERLRLFLQICAAVDHAHQRLVVHRDLKPRNILVTPAGAPMLLDFGIGKVLDAGATFGSAIETRADVRLLTPEYAAPEQLTGAVVTTATDVYALGVILHEILVGEHPYVVPGMSRQQLEASVLATPPETASARARTSRVANARSTDPAGLARRLAGDLDTIILMALRKEPERRYPSASALAADISRHLDGLPVSARPDTAGYRVRKFIGRNRGAVIAGAAIVFALIGIAATSVIQSRRVAAEALRTAQERDKALEVRGFLMEMFGATGADQAVGDTVSVRALLDRQRALVDRAYAGRDAVKADMLDALADGYDRLGLYADAEPMARRALELRERLLPADHPDVAASLNLLGWILHERGASTTALPLLARAERLRRADSARAPADLARTLNDIGVVYNAQQRWEDAVVVLSEALRIRRAEFGDWHRAVGITANNIAAAWYSQKRNDSAVVMQQLAIRSLQAAVGPDHQRTIVATSNLALFMQRNGEIASAESVYRELMTRQTRLQGPDHPVTARLGLSLAMLLSERGEREAADAVLAEAESLYRNVTIAFEKRLGPRHPQLATATERLGLVIASRGRAREGIGYQVRALAILRATAADSSRSVRVMAERLAAAWRRAGDSAAARAVERQVGLVR